jgi:hypothetical protein
MSRPAGELEKWAQECLILSQNLVNYLSVRRLASVLMIAQTAIAYQEVTS